MLILTTDPLPRWFCRNLVLPVFSWTRQKKRKICGENALTLLLAVILQLKRELKKGRAFDGWTEGILEFVPTYKY
jgi:hypothetical protein